NPTKQGTSYTNKRKKMQRQTSNGRKQLQRSRDAQYEEDPDNKQTPCTVFRNFQQDSFVEEVKHTCYVVDWGT
ncbi:unnamed protein product, partial [Ilex paraguariensis]